MKDIVKIPEHIMKNMKNAKVKVKVKIKGKMGKGGLRKALMKE